LLFSTKSIFTFGLSISFSLSVCPSPPLTPTFPPARPPATFWCARVLSLSSIHLFAYTAGTSMPFSKDAPLDVALLRSRGRCARRRRPGSAAWFGVSEIPPTSHTRKRGTQSHAHTNPLCALSLSLSLARARARARVRARTFSFSCRRKLQRSVSETQTQEQFSLLSAIKLLVGEIDNFRFSLVLSSKSVELFVGEIDNFRSLCIFGLVIIWFSA
jgi:hypothetical protein